MRRFVQPEVLKVATLAALGTALASWPRLSMWSARTLPLWYLEATLFLGGIVLWGFVFAWHTEYTGRPVVTFKMEPTLLALVTVIGVFAAICLRLFVDPTLRIKTPDDYPDDFHEWIAMTLFSLGLSQLFLVFAPLAWSIRLFKSLRVATVLTVLFGVVVLVLKSRSSPTPLPFAMFAALLIARLLMGSVAIYFYLRGGLILAWWLAFLIEARHLLDFG